MSQLDPQRTTADDLCKAALKDSGAYGVGQTPLAEDISDAKARLQWMMQQWQRKRWFIYHLVTMSCTAQVDPRGQFQGKQAYTVGPGGDFNTNISNRPQTEEFDGHFGSGYATSSRPNRIESAFLRQLTMSQPNQIDYPLTQLNSREDYNQIALKGLSSFPGYFFYDTDWNLGLLYPWPIPQANIYEVHITFRAMLPPMFTQAAAIVDLPWEYYNAMVLQLAIRLRPKYGIVAMQGDTLAGQAKDALNTIKKANFQIARLRVPGDLARPQLYNIFSDRMY